MTQSNADQRGLHDAQTDAVFKTASVSQGLPQGWRWAKLGDVARVVSGSTPRSGVSEFWSGDIVWITPTDLGQLRGAYIKGSLRRITKTGYDSCGTELVPRGAVVLSSRAPIGHLGIADKSLCTNQGCKSFVPSELLDSEFLYFVLKASVPELKSLGSGATFAEVSKSQLENYEIPLPPLGEQQRIAAVLNEKMAAVAQARVAAQAQLAAAKALPAAYLREVFESEEAQGWEIRKVTYLCERIDYGFTASADFSVQEPRFLRITDSQNGRVDWDTVPGCQIGSKEEEANKLADGDIVFARTGATTGKSFLIRHPPRAVFASYLIRMKTKREIHADYLYAFFQSDGYWRQIRASARGGAQPNVNATLLGNVFLPVASIARQREVALHLAKHNEAVGTVQSNLESQLAAIEQLPGALLRRAFSGGL